MSIIQKIRDKYAKLAGFVIGLALIAFILSDLGSSSFGSLFGNSTEVAEVNGEEIDQITYQTRIQEYETLYSLNPQNAILDDNTRAQLHQQALNDLIMEKVLNEQAEQIGITVTEDEKRELIYGPNPDPFIRQYPVFTNPETGVFDQTRIALYEKQLKTNDPTNGEEAKKWENFKNFVIRNHKMSKFNNMLAAAAYIPKLEIDQYQANQQAMVSFDFVKLPYTLVEDKDVKVTDADLDKYIADRKKLYTIPEPSRNVEYVSFEIVPSAKDSAASLEAVSTLIPGLAAATDAESFVNRNSDEQFEDRFLSKLSFGSIYADSIIDLPVGSVYGPYLENNAYKIAKVIEKKVLPDSASAKHILIGVSQVRDDSSAKLRADSVYAMLQSGVNFDSLAMVYSDDVASKSRGGELGYFIQGTMVPEFNDAVFQGKVGELARTKTTYGYHIIKITDQKNFNNAVKVAFVTKALYPSEATESEIYAKANEFAGKYGQSKTFEEGIKKGLAEKRKADNIKMNDFVVPGLGPSRDFIQWIFSAEMGEVSGVITMGEKYIIAKLVGEQDKGLMQVDERTRPMLEAAVKAEKKAVILKQKFKGSLETIAQQSAQTIQSADSVSLANGYIKDIGYEPKVVGFAFNQKFATNTVSPGISGQDAVYYISVKQREQRTIDPAMNPFLNQQKQSLEGQLKNAFSSSTLEMLKRNAEVKYNGSNLY